MTSWTGTQLFVETIPRSVFFGYVQLFLLTGNLPSSYGGQKNPAKVDPLFLLTQTYKNYQYNLDSYFDCFENPEWQEVERNNYGVSSKAILAGKSPIWAHYAYNTNWYRKQIDIYRRLQPYFYFIPGIKNIYLTASSTAEISGQSRDLDIIIHTHRGWVWPIRIITKTFLKIQGRDVHSSLGELGLTISSLIARIPFLQKKALVLKKASQQRIYEYKNRDGLKIDVGLIFDDPKTLPKIFKKESRHLLFFTSLRINYTNQIPSKVDFFEQGDLLYEPFSAKYRKVFWLVNKIILTIISFLFSPIIILIALYYYLKNKNNPNFLVNWGTVCFYPLIYKEGWFVRVG